MIELHPPFVPTHGAGRSSDLDDMFEMFFGGSGQKNRPIGMQGDIGWRPATDVYETQDEFTIQVDLAGMRREEIEVLIDEGFVIVKGTRRDIAPPGKKHFHKMEIMVGPFERHIRIPATIDGTSAEACYRNGFLFVTLQKGSGRMTERCSIAITQDLG